VPRVPLAELILAGWCAASLVSPEVLQKPALMIYELADCDAV